jgi:hypothetical protein
MFKIFYIHFQVINGKDGYGIAQRLHTGDLMASYEYSNNALGLSENICELVAETEKFVKTFSWFFKNSTLYYKAKSIDDN